MSQTIRPWELNDLPGIQNVLWKTWVDSYSSFIPEEDLKTYFKEHYDVNALTELFHFSPVVGFVAEVDGLLAGFMRTTHEEEENRFYVSSLYVLPKFQGLGLGRQLMVRAAEEAKKHLLDKIWLGVMTQNEPAFKWYQNMGYQVMKVQPFKMGRTSVEHYIGYLPVSLLKVSNGQNDSISEAR